MSPPPASKTMSVVASSVIVEPESISVIIGVVNVLLVSVAVETVDSKVPLPPSGNNKVFEADWEWGAPWRVCACWLLDSQ